jgi:uncharacterized protein (TIGR02302 family)
MLAKFWKRTAANARPQDALVRRAQAILAAERAARALAFLISWALLFLALSWSGLWLALGPTGRAVGVALFAAVAAFAALRAALRVWPPRAEAIARIDAAAPPGLRPAASLDDRLADPAPTAATASLWAAHRRRLTAALNAIRLQPPQPALAPRDPYALRGLALVAAVAAAVAAGGDRGQRLAAAFDWRFLAAGGDAARVDAWIAPPAYTGRPQTTLTGPGDAPIAAPVNSLIHVRAQQDSSRLAGGLVPAQDASAPAGSASPDQTYKLTGDATIQLPDGRAYALSAIPDLPPTIVLVGTPRANARGSLTLSFRTDDDYGVAGAEAVISSETAKTALVPPPRAGLPLPAERNGRGDARATLDFSESPWAGARVKLSLTARDDGGNDVQTSAIEIELPQRRFAKPLARALVEQRRLLVLDPAERAKVGQALAALDIAPEMFDTPAAVHLGLHEALRALARRPSDDQLRSVADMLWTMALSIEDGDLSQAEKDLRAAEKNLREALERGADDEEISRLTQDLRAALDNFLQGLAKSARRNQESAQSPQAGGDGESVSEQDLQSMLDDMAKAGKSGDLDEARRMLDSLQDILENLQMSENGAGGGKRGSRARNAAKAQSELDRLSREQQQLRDETFQKSRPGDAANDPGDEKRRQEALRQRLDRQKDALRRSGEETPGELDAAEEAMKEAESALGQGPRGRGAAVDAQGRALQALRRGADKMAERARGAGQGEEEDENAEADSRRGSKPGDSDTPDPLGRPQQKSRAAKFDAPALRARRVQDEVRRRLGQPERPPQELDYLERLLKR